MANIPVERRGKIIEWLKAEPVLTIDELAGRLSISNMTVHRDLDVLSNRGLVEKVHGGVRLTIPQADLDGDDVCAMCHMPIGKRLYFVINVKDKTPISACCAHCGLLILSQQDHVVMALLRDFIYGRIINVRQAFFVIGSQISLCCEPSVLAFATMPDAMSFSQGFGGEVMSFVQATQYLSESHFV